MEESKDKVEKKISPLTTDSVKGISRIGTSSASGRDMSTMDEALGQIFVILKRMDKFDRLQNEKQLVDLQISQLEETDRNQKLIKALRGLPRKPKGKRKLLPEEEKSKPQPSAPSKPTGQPPKTTGRPPSERPPERPPAPAPARPPVQAPAQPPVKAPAQAPAQPPVKAPAQPPVKAPAQPPAQAPAPTTTPVKPPAPAPSTAVKIATGAAAVTAALSGREALAANISKYESGDKGYNAYNRGDFFLAKKNEGAYLKSNNIDFSKMTIADYLKRTNKKLKAGGVLDASDPNVLFAVGKYQLIPGTMKVMAEKLKLDPNKTYLTPDIQDMLFAKGLTTKGSGGRFAVDDYINGKEGSTRDAAILALAMEFASVGVPYDIKAKSLFKNTLPNVDLKKGETFYKTPGGFNKAHNPPEVVGQALDTDRAKKLNQSSTTQSAPANNTGVTINNSSVDNRDMKADANAQQSAPINVNNTYENKKSSPSSGAGGGSDDTNPYEKKKRQ